MRFIRRLRETNKDYLKWAARLGALLAAVILASFGILLAAAKLAGPMDIPAAKPAVFYDDRQQPIGKWQGKSSQWISIDTMSSPIKMATLAVEDRRFFQHHGFDFRRIAGSAMVDLRSFSNAEGASTITMQYAKNLFLTNNRTWQRKAEEMFYTLRLEMNESKKDILEGYLNTIYYGEGAYGIEAAAKTYFNKNASDLTLAEASMLAGIPNAPSLYSPFLHYNQAKMRQKTVLESMVESGFLTKKQAEAVYSAPVRLVRGREKTAEEAPYFQDAVRQELTRLHFSQKELASGGLKVYTTLNPNAQQAAEYWVRKTLPANSGLETALIALDPKTGGVAAMIGGRDYQKSPYNRAISAERAPGSTFKPFLYYAALQNGFTPATLLKSMPTVFTFDNGKATYAPNNFGGYYANGPITMAQALALSDNIFAVKTHLAIGMGEMIQAARLAGITSPLEAVPSLALGSEPVSVLEMARGYATFANEGARINPQFITKVTDGQGRVLYEWHPEKKQVLNKQASFVLSQMMTGIFDSRLNGYTKVTGGTVANMLTHTLAAKTGSTPTDSWMTGFSPDLVSAVWVGYDKGETINTYPDGSYAKEIWSHFMESALDGTPKNLFTPPEGVIRVSIDPKSGLLASAQCPGRPTYFVKGTEPILHCSASQGHPDTKAKQPLRERSFLYRLFHWW